MMMYGKLISYFLKCLHSNFAYGHCVASKRPEVMVNNFMNHYLASLVTLKLCYTVTVPVVLSF